MTAPREQLAKVVKDHRRNQSTGSGGTYECICGEPLTSNSHHRQAEHLADAIIAAGWRPPKVKKPKPPHDPRVISVEETKRMLNREWGWY